MSERCKARARQEDPKSVSRTVGPLSMSQLLCCFRVPVPWSAQVVGDGFCLGELAVCGCSAGPRAQQVLSSDCDGQH